MYLGSRMTVTSSTSPWKRKPMQSDCSFSRPDTAATGLTTNSSAYPSSDRSFAYSIISSKFQSTGEVLLLPKVNARRSIRFDKSMTGPKIMAVRETAQWLINNNNRMTDDLSKECRRLDDSYLKWYRKHFNEKKDVLEKVSNLLSHAKKEKIERCRSYQSCYNKSTTPASRGRKSNNRSVTHQRGSVFPTELPDVEIVDDEKVDKTPVVELEGTVKLEGGDEDVPAASPSKTSTDTAKKGVKENTPAPGGKKETVSPGAKGRKAVKGETENEERKKDGNGKNQKADGAEGKNGNGKSRGVRIIEPQSKGNN